ncbi:MAG: relaxase/mobilization nuclease domain-containing protein [Ruminococcus sp.]|nr:relaxase/mobilization nuclease domain-containing protein [Ruminococcus sp.]
MAYTKIHPIKTTPDLAIAYILNPDKTENSLLVSSFACTAKTASIEFQYTRSRFNSDTGNLAYHCIQSFKPDEVTAEQAHRIGIQTADEMLKGKYEYVVATHVDRGHYHNHIIINGVNFENGLSFCSEHDQFKNPAWKQLRKISDEICMENSLSVIELPEKGYGKCYYEWLKDKQNSSYKSKLKATIDKCIMTADSFDDFLEKMQNDMKYEYKVRGNSVSFRAEEQERFTRCSKKNFGWYYEPEQLKKRIERQVRKRTAALSRDSGFYRVSDESAVGLNRWATLKNMQEASRMLNVLTDLGVHSVEELEEKISEKFDHRFDTVDELKKLEKEIGQQRELLKMLNAYWSSKTVHDEFLKVNNRKCFEKEHSKELSVYASTKEWLKEKYKGNALPNRSVLEVKIEENESKYETLLEDYHGIKKELNALNDIREKVDKFFELQEQEQNRKKAKGELE